MIRNILAVIGVVLLAALVIVAGPAMGRVHHRHHAEMCLPEVDTDDEPVDHTDTKEIA